MDTADLIRRARWAVGMSQADLARAADVAPAALCRYERGARVPSLPTLVRLLEATGHQLSAELETLDADLLEPLEEAQRVPVDERDTAVLWGGAGPWLTELPHRVEGLSALSLLGAPVRAARLEIAVAATPQGWSRLARAIGEFDATPWELGHGLGWRPSRPDALQEWATEPPQRGQFEITLGTSPGRVRMVGPEVAARQVPVATRWGAVPVAPVHELEVTDRRARRVLRLLRERVRETRR